MEDWKDILSGASKVLHEQMKMKSEDLKAGTVVYMPLNREDGLVIDPKYKTRNKFFVIIGITEKGDIIGSVLINTKPAVYNDEIVKCQYLLLQRNYSMIINHDSWIDCSELFVFERQRIIKEGERHGSINAKDFDIIINIIRDTPLISNKIKRRFGI